MPEREEEFRLFLKMRKKSWVTPIVLVLCVSCLLIVATQVSALERLVFPLL